MAGYPRLSMHLGDYIRDTPPIARANWEHHGIYLLALFIAWNVPGIRLPNDPKWIAERMGCTADEYEAHVAPVILRYFKSPDGNWLYQKRLSKEGKFVKNQSVRAKSRWRKEKKGYRNANPAYAPTPTPTPTPTQDKKDSPPVGPPQGGRPPPRQRKALTDEGWRPNAKQHAYALDTLGSDAMVEACVDEFVSYWIGAGKPMADWNQTFHNSVLKFKQRKGNGNGKAPVTGHNRRVIEKYLEQSQTNERRRAAGHQPDLLLIQGRPKADG